MGPSGQSWLKLSALGAAISAPSVGTKCSTRNLNRSPWTDEDDNLLESSVDTHGRNWESIAQPRFQNRSALSLKNRHALLLRQQARGIQNQTDIPQIPGSDLGIGAGP